MKAPVSRDATAKPRVAGDRGDVSVGHRKVLSYRARRDGEIAITPCRLGIDEQDSRLEQRRRAVQCGGQIVPAPARGQRADAEGQFDDGDAR